MYQFTKETIINSNLDSNGVSTKFFADDANNVFSVLRSGNFPAARVTSAIKIPYVAPVKETLTKTITTANSDVAKTYRLYVKLRRVGSYTSDYANAMTRNFLEKFYEVAGVTSGTASTLVASLETAINKENNFKDNVYFTVSKSGAALTLTAIDEYTHFEKVEIHEVLASSASLTGYDSFTVLEDVLATGTLTLGTEGFGTVKQITKNLRLPTLANTSWLAIGQDERPIPGGEYNCYILKLKTVDTEQGGVSTVGQELTSVTTHKFYVLSTLVTVWEAAMTEAGIQITLASDGTSVNTLV